ncbi:baseplate J/gp47 family protein [Roseibium sediminis]|uniref:baseplate J/gp47 family protein n=1 Tax=Roseibium sediminis TaxID=1775174 RepID=UPI00123D0B73|nr:baseplate J/gp47 family protein [Roseibium sediminis]
MIDLEKLPKPEVIEELDFEQIHAEQLADVKARLEARGYSFDTGGLNSEVIAIVLQATSFRELEVRSRINNAARSNLLAFAFKNGLEQLAAWLGVARLEGESDERLKRRYQLATIGRSAGGPPERYKDIALKASAEVRDVKVWSDEDSPLVNVAVLSAIGDGSASMSLLAIVRAALEQKSVKVTNDRFNVMSAVRRTEDLHLRARLAPDAPASLIEAIGPHLKSEWVKQDLLGLDLEPSWIIATGRLPGITSLEVLAPHGLIEAKGFEAIALGDIAVEYVGRGR